MPRFTLTNLEKQMLAGAITDYASANGIPLVPDALVAVALTTNAELMTVAQQYLQEEKAKRQAQLATIQTRAAAEEAKLNTEIAAIDSTLAKLV